MITLPSRPIHVAREQALLLAHSAVVMQHPFYWYSTPALLKEWQDHVLQFGWAYGPKGTALRGKQLLTAISTGGSVEAYRPEGMHGTTVRALLAFIAAHSYAPFAWYRIAFGAFILLSAQAGWIDWSGATH